MKRIMITARMSLILATAMFLHTVTKGQGTNPNAPNGIRLTPDFVAEKVADLSITPRGSHWVTFRPGSRISPTELFRQHRRSFLLSSDDDMILTRSEVDDLGYTHYRYQQTYKGIKVEGAEMLVHARGGDAVRVNGHLPEIPSADEVAANGISLGASQALLLKKIEELTLYMIEMQRENEALRERVVSIEGMVRQQ